MKFFSSVIAYLKQRFGPEIAGVEADLAKADAYLAEHAAAAEKLAQVVVDFIRLAAPQLAPEAQVVVTGGENVLAELQALYAKYFGTPDAPA